MMFCRIGPYRFGDSGGFQYMIRHRIRRIVADMIEQAPLHMFGGCLDRYRNRYSKVIFGDSAHSQNRTYKEQNEKRYLFSNGFGILRGGTKTGFEACVWRVIGAFLLLLVGEPITKVWMILSLCCAGSKPALVSAMGASVDILAKQADLPLTPQLLSLRLLSLR